MSKFTTLLEATMVRYQATSLLPGDLLKFKKGFEKSEWAKANPDKIKKIGEWLATGKNIRLSITKSVPSGVHGSFGSHENELNNLADITLELAPGLYSDFMTVPSSILEVIDTDNNLAPIPDSSKKKDPTQIKPSEVKVDKSKEPGKRTHKGDKEGEGDRELKNKNVNIPHGNKWNDKKPGGGNHKAKLNESSSLRKSEEELIFEAYMSSESLDTKGPFGAEGMFAARKPTQAAPAALKVGDKVKVMFESGNLLTGTVTKELGDGKYLAQFARGTEQFTSAIYWGSWDQGKTSSWKEDAHNPANT